MRVDPQHLARAEVDDQQLFALAEGETQQRVGRARHMQHALQRAILAEHEHLAGADRARGAEAADIEVAVSIRGDAFGIRRARRQRGEALDAAAIPRRRVEAKH